MKKMILIIFITLPYFINSQTAAFKVLEVKGNVDIRERGGKWKEVTDNELISDGCEIFTGLHSHISFEIGENSYITMNQLTNGILDKIRIQKELITSEVYLVNGYIIVSTKNTKLYKSRISVTFMDGKANFENSSGEVYLRKEYGALISSGKGRVSVYSQNLNRYDIYSQEKCAVLPGGRMVENEKFLMDGISGKPSGFASENQLNIFIEKFYNYYSDPLSKSDYGR